MKKFAFFTALVLLIGLVGAAQADPISVNNAKWYEFGFSAVGVPATDGAGTVPSSGGNSQPAPTPPWTFANAVPVFLTVVDAFLEGDAFNIFDFGNPVGATSAVASTGNPSGTDDPVVALTIPTLSRGIFGLLPGNHSLTFEPYQVVSVGAAFFTVTTECPCPVPLPGTLMLLSSALVGLVGIGIRKKM